MPTITKTATRARGSGTVVTGSPHHIKFPTNTKVVSFMAQADAGQTVKLRYTLDDSATILWADWTYGDADDSQVWAAVFDGGFYMIEISGTGKYSYSWD